MNIVFLILLPLLCTVLRRYLSRCRERWIVNAFAEKLDLAPSNTSPQCVGYRSTSRHRASDTMLTSS
jgi:hypothetical protein